MYDKKTLSFPFLTETKAKIQYSSGASVSAVEHPSVPLKTGLEIFQPTKAEESVLGMGDCPSCFCLIAVFIGGSKLTWKIFLNISKTIFCYFSHVCTIQLYLTALLLLKVYNPPQNQLEPKCQISCLTTALQLSHTISLPQ